MSQTSKTGRGIKVVCALARKLLAEKLIDDFYEEQLHTNAQNTKEPDELTELLKVALAEDKHELLFRWEARCAENCGAELRKFANFVAQLMLDKTVTGCTKESEA
ncbi:MAG: hypothetical protein JJ714_11510 [Acidithiobacillus sp.]|nr:hypothetical protein [Acidithiobacillus sp.]